MSCATKRRPSCEPHVGQIERQRGEWHEHGAYKSEGLFLVINMEMAEEEKACNCEISVQRALPALLPVLRFLFFPPIFLAPSPLLPPVQQGTLIGSSLMRVNDWRMRASLWTKQIISSAVKSFPKDNLGIFCSRPY